MSLNLASDQDSIEALFSQREAMKDTGRIFIYVAQKNSLQQGYIEVKNGKVVGVKFRGKTDASAIFELLGAPIKRVYFIAKKEIAGINHGALPDIHDILEKIQGKDFSGASISGNLSLANVDEFTRELENLFVDYMGKKGAKMLAGIRAKHGRHLTPKQLMALCQKKLEMYFGANKTANILEPFHSLAH